MLGRIVVKIGDQSVANEDERRVAGVLAAIEHETPIPFLANFGVVYVAVRRGVAQPATERAPVIEETRHQPALHRGVIIHRIGLFPRPN